MNGPRKLYVKSFGCQMNVYDSHRMADMLAPEGFAETARVEEADLVALARPHLTNPYFTLQASAWYQHAGQHWPPQYLSGRDQAFRLAERERAELAELRLRARPASHEVKDSGVRKAA